VSNEERLQMHEFQLSASGLIIWRIESNITSRRMNFMFSEMNKRTLDCDGDQFEAGL
jgi:hypothetical protein